MTNLIPAWATKTSSQVFVNGMFAFVLYDSGRDEYFVARDPVSIYHLHHHLCNRHHHYHQVGIIPLYIGYGGDGTTWFSSELKGLQKHCDHIEVRPHSF